MVPSNLKSLDFKKWYFSLWYFLKWYFLKWYFSVLRSSSRDNCSVWRGRRTFDGSTVTDVGRDYNKMTSAEHAAEKYERCKLDQRVDL